ncbi:MAG: D-2-hydroxyacid dehydrogenase [Opitutus sp.]|nr:D-2-hydroxyacid dehydrogenase [Opitutus sp.]
MKLLLYSSTFKFTATQRDDLRAIWPGMEIDEQPVAPGALEKIAGAGVEVLVSDPAPRNIEAWPNLRLVQLLSAGANQLVDHPILPTAIPVATASGLHGVPIAQYVTCTWLMMAHRVPTLFGYKSDRTWPDRNALPGLPVRGMTAGILGYGSIGRECARQLHALGMRVVCLKRDPTRLADPDFNAWPGTGDPEGKIPEAWFAPTQLPEMLPRCELVVVTVPSTPQTQGMFGPAEFALLPKGARMIIVSRGGIVDERALAETLRAGHLAGAAVDCFVVEPVPKAHEFFDEPNLIMTPHVSGIYDAFWPGMVRLLGENLRRLRSGQPLLNQVDRQHGY